MTAGGPLFFVLGGILGAEEMRGIGQEAQTPWVGVLNSFVCGEVLLIREPVSWILPQKSEAKSRIEGFKKNTGV